MSLDLAAWRPPPVLPSRAGAASWIILLLALVVSLAAAVTLAWLAADLRTRPALLRRLGGEATIAIEAPRPLAGLESSDAAAWRAAEVLRATPGVASVRILEPLASDQQIAAAIGAAGSATDPPRLIALTFAPGARRKGVSLMNSLARAGLAGAVDDHGPVSGTVEHASLLAGVGLGVFGLLMLGAFAGLGGWGAARRIAGLEPRILLLSRLGMSDKALIGRILAPVILAAVGAAILGAGIGLGVEEILALRPIGVAHFIPSPTGRDLLAMAAWPPLAVGASILTAARVAERGIRRVCG